MTKKILLLTAFILLLICSNLLGDLREVIITVLPYSGDVHDCYLYLNTYDVYMEKVNETWNGEDIAELRTYAVIYNLAYGDGGIVTYPTMVHIWLDDGDYPNGNTWVGGEGYVHYFGYPCWANGEATLFDNQAWLELTSTEIPEPQYRVTVSNPFDEAYNCSMILRPGEPNEEILFENETIPAGETDYTFDPYEIYMYEGDEVQVDGNIAGFYPGQEYSVSASGSVQFQLIPHSPYPPVQAEYFVELELSSPDMPDYEFRTTHLSADGWNWVSFPVMDPEYSHPTNHVLAPIANPDILEEVRRYVPFAGYKKIYWDFDHWHVPPEMETFRSIDGYKIKMNNTADLTVAGYWEDPTTGIPLYEGEENWIGYFLPETQDCEDAFGEDWDKVISIKAENWYYHIPYQNPTKYVPEEECPRPGPPRPLECGEGYIVKVDEDILDFTWRNSGNTKEPYGKAESDYFTFEEAADYMPIFVDSSEVTEGVNEVGVFIDDECIGASKVEEYPVLILAYVEDDNLRDGSELSFQLYNGTKNVATQVNGVAVYDPVTFAYVDRPVYLNKDDFVIVRLNTEEAPEIPREFTLSQNYPNPVQSSTTISFSTAEGAENPEIEIYNVKGQLVKDLGVTGYELRVGKAVWDGKDNNGNQLSNGIYFYKFISGEKTAVKKMILLR